MAAFRAALVLDFRQHRLAWSIIASGLLSCLMLWGSILGVPLRPATFDMAAAPGQEQVEQTIDLSDNE